MSSNLLAKAYSTIISLSIIVCITMRTFSHSAPPQKKNTVSINDHDHCTLANEELLRLFCSPIE